MSQTVPSPRPQERGLHSHPECLQLHPLERTLSSLRPSHSWAPSSRKISRLPHHKNPAQLLINTLVSGSERRDNAFPSYQPTGTSRGQVALA